MKKKKSYESEEQLSNLDVEKDLLESLAKTLNDSKKGKTGPSAFLLGSHEYAKVPYFVPTGAFMLDLAVSNKPNGGWPAGRISEITGLEGTGKSLLAAHAIASTQKMGGIGVFIDTESAVSADFFEAIGVDVSKMLLVQTEYIEEVFETIDAVLTKVAKDNVSKPITIVVDSIAGATTREEVETEYGVSGYATQKARILSESWRRLTNLISRYKVTVIVTNQLRQRLGVSFGDPWCVDPYTTKVKIRYKALEEEITLAEFSERFLGNSDFSTPSAFDLDGMGIEVLTRTKEGLELYKPIKSFLVKETVSSYWTDGLLKASSEHSVVEDGDQIKVKSHPQFHEVEESMSVVDIEVEGEHTYLANGRLNHNTTAGGKSTAFHSSVRVRLKGVGQLKGTVNGVEQVVGVQTRAQIVKNRVGPPFRSIGFNIHFDSGVDDAQSWLDMMTTYNICSKSGSWYVYISDETGEEVKFQKKSFIEEILQHDYLRDEIYKKICDSFIMKYKNVNDVDVSELELEEMDFDE